MNKYRKCLVFLYLICGGCQASEKNTKLEEYMEEGYVLTTLEETRKIVHAEIKNIVIAQSLDTVNSNEVGIISTHLSNLENRFTNIATAKLRLDRDNAFSSNCNFFQLGVQTGIVKNSIDEVFQCIITPCSKNEQAAITEELFLKIAELDKENTICLEFLYRAKKTDRIPPNNR